MVSDFTTLREALHRVHGVEAKWIESVQVSDVFDGGVAWRGTVEVFDVTGHQQARRAFAWALETGGGSTKILAVLAIPPIALPRDAVRAAIAAEREP